MSSASTPSIRAQPPARLPVRRRCPAGVRVHPDPHPGDRLHRLTSKELRADSAPCRLCRLAQRAGRRRRRHPLPERPPRHQPPPAAACRFYPGEVRPFDLRRAGLDRAFAATRPDPRRRRGPAPQGPPGRPPWNAGARSCRRAARSTGGSPVLISDAELARGEAGRPPRALDVAGGDAPALTRSALTCTTQREMAGDAHGSSRQIWKR